MRRIVLLAISTAILFSCATQPETSEERLATIYPAERPFAESRFVDIAGLTIHYRAWAPEGDPAGKVILLHGIGGSTYSFNELAPRLARRGYSVVAVDLPGFGFSDPALDFDHTPANRLGVIWTLVDRLDTDDNQFNPLDRWHVIGHQMGGEFAVWMATDRPGRIAGLTLIAAVLGDNRPGGSFAWFPPVRWALRAWLKNSLYTAGGVRELLEDAYNRAPTEQAVDGYLAPVVLSDARRALSNYTRTVGREQPPLGEVVVPVLYIWGDSDSWRSLEDGREQSAVLQHVAFEVIEGAGHAPMDTHPDEVTSLFTTWVAAAFAEG